MPRYNTVTKPTGGLVGDRIDTSIISKQLFPDMQNIMKYEDYFGQRPGRTSYGDVAGMVTAYYHFKIGDYNKFLKFTTTNVYHRNVSDWTVITGTTLTGGLDNLFDACTVYDGDTGTPYVVFTNGADNIRKYIGSGNTSDMSGWTDYKARFVRYLDGYLICFHLTASGTRNGFSIRRSKINEPNNATDGATYNLTKGKKLADIMKAEYFGDYIAVFTTDNIFLLWLVDTSDVLRYDVVVHNTGLRASRAVAEVPGGALFFLGFDDFYYWASPTSAPKGLTTSKIKRRFIY